MKKVKYAIIGFGGIAENRIAKEGFGCDKSRFNGLPNAELVGATDMNPAREAAAKALGLKWYKSMDDIIADPEIDAVYVATNNATHAEMTIKALEAGCHVLCEKPMAITLEECEAMVEAAKKNNKYLMIGQNQPLAKAHAKAKCVKEVVPEGRLLVHTKCQGQPYGKVPFAALWPQRAQGLAVTVVPRPMDDPRM